MKNRRALIFSVLCGLAAVALTYSYIAQKEKLYSDKYQQIAVLIANQDIARYQEIGEEALAVKQIPKPFVLPGALTLADRERVVGYIAEATILTGEQITSTKIARPGESRISITIEKDARACTIAVDEVSGVASLIRPGDHVDVIGTFKTIDEKTRVAKNAEATTIFQNLQILSVGKNYLFDATPGKSGDRGILPSSRTETSFSNVTVSATPRQCMDLAVAQQVGVLTLTLRSYYNRFEGKTFTSLKDKRSTAASVTGIQSPLEISKQPKWLEIRGEKAIFSP